MFIEIVATLFAGVAGAGVVLLVNKLTGGRLPKWAMPIGAGLSMIVATIANEYGWYDRTAAALPEGVVVIMEIENKSLYRPWTYVTPFVERFVALDEPSLRTHEARPSIRMADLYFMGRWSAYEKLSVLADCENRRRAPLMDDIEFLADGDVAGAEWLSVSRDDAIVTAICKLEAAS